MDTMERMGTKKNYVTGFSEKGRATRDPAGVPDIFKYKGPKPSPVTLPVIQLLWVRDLIPSNKNCNLKGFMRERSNKSF